MTTKTLLLIALLTPLLCFGDAKQEVVEKDNLKLGDTIFHAHYIEYSEPVAYNKWKPVEGEQPDWAKSQEIAEEWYLHTFEEVTNCISPLSLKMSGITSEEAFANAKKEYIEIPEEQKTPVTSERYLISQLYLTNEDHEYLYVEMQLPTPSPKSFCSIGNWLEKVNDNWIDVTCDTIHFDWSKALTSFNKEALKSGTKSNEWLKEFLSVDSKMVTEEK